MEKSKEELQRVLTEYREDPALRDFYPVIERMLDSLEAPDEKDISEVLDLLDICLYKHACYQLAEGAYINGALSRPVEKHYDDYD